VAVAAGVLAVPGRAGAFHEQGTANCNGCHLSHPDEAGDAALAGPSADAGLLIAESPSDVCLLCHAESLGAVLGPDPLVPPPERGAGNFTFLLEDNLNDAEGGALDPVPGDAAGHNLAAPGHALTPDSRHSRAPGGSFPSDRLGCTSCHDPHGNPSYRMLHGVGPVMGGVATFARPAPEADGIDLGSRPEGRRHHNAYRRGMSEWCGNCHGRYHEAGSGSAFEHRIDVGLGASVSQRYNEYRGDREPTAGLPATAYLPEVPFEDPASTTSSTRGTSPRSRIMCLSCHRAHGTSSPAAGRWDFGVTFLVDDGRESGSYRIPDPYGDPTQGPLCGKCHELSPGGDLVPPPDSGRFPPPPSWPTGDEPPD
jgi:hypothetical protein